jgi:hypothetical protein
MENQENLKVLEVLIEELIRQRQLILNGVPLYDDLKRREQEQKNVNRFCDGIGISICIANRLLENGGFFDKDDFLI